MVSIIIPVYNGEKTIERCLKSVSKQTYHDIEIIVINDGSTDKTIDILKSWKNRDNRIRFFSTENHGVSAARNYAIAQIRGEFCSFVDADDLICEQYIELLLNACISQETDIAVAPIARECSEKDVTDTWNVGIGDIQKIAVDDTFDYTKQYVPRTVWGGIYRTTLVKQFRFDEKLFVGEDTLFLAQMINCSKFISFIPLRLYCYVRTSESAVRGTWNSKKMTEMIAWEKICELFKDRGYRFRCNCYAAYVLSCYNIYIKIVDGSNNNNYESQKKRVLSFCRHNFGYVISGNLSISQKVKIAIFCMSPKNFFSMRKGKNIFKKRRS